MAVLKNTKHEAFAEGLALGLTVSDAYKLSGLTAKPFELLEGFYVYLLIDPRTDRVFYVGKGKGKRALRHIAQAKSGKGQNALKCETILAILTTGDVVIHILESDVSEREALRIERMLIVRAGQGLTNSAMGSLHPLDRVKREAKHGLARIKSRAALIAEGASDARIAIRDRIVQSLERLAAV